MLLTEKEAKAKWCPFVNGDGTGDEKCIASECMAWRWFYNPDNKTNTGKHGYCGLASKPE